MSIPMNLFEIANNKKVNWEESNNEFGTTLEEMKAELQSISLKYLKSNPIKKDGIKLGDKHNYYCAHESCDYLARIVDYTNERCKRQTNILTKITQY